MVLKRVVVTGLGALTPIGNNVQEYWNGLVNGVSGAAPITYFDASKFKTQFACELKNFNVEDFIDRKDARKMDRYAQYAMVSSEEAMNDANFDLDKIDKLGDTTKRDICKQLAIFAMKRMKPLKFVPFDNYEGAGYAIQVDMNFIGKKLK